MLSNYLKKTFSDTKYAAPIILLIALWNLMSILYLVYVRTYNKEGYETYTKCIKQGYSNKFCLHVPVEACINNCNFKKWKPKY
tara:strand:+ start:167 stop:415 length:249 start_codon:yes stop_codon:yes gene_type:complete